MRRLRVSVPLLAMSLLFGAGQMSAQVAAKASARNSASPAKAAQNSPSARPLSAGLEKSSPIRLPLFFEANQGQADPRVRFLTRSKGYTLILTPTETVLVESRTQPGGAPSAMAGRGAWKSAPGSAVRMQLLGANPSPSLTPLEELPGKVNYLIGKDPRDWHTGVPLYSKVRTNQVYSGIDLLFHGDQDQLEYDFVLSPGADPSHVAFRVTGAKRIELDAQGDLVLHTAESEFRMHKPVVYQPEGSERRTVEGRFVLKGKHRVGFEVFAYDPGKPLVIDPTITFATFLGGAGNDKGADIAVDTSNSAAPKLYIPGQTDDITTFPEAGSTLLNNPGGKRYTFLAKIDPTQVGAASLDYLTFLGGGTNFTGAAGCKAQHGHLVLDTSQGAANIEPVLVGVTDCKDFPVNPVNAGVVPTAGAVNDDYVTRLMPSGAAIDSSIFFGGNGEQGGGWVSVDATGNVILSDATTATNLPTTAGAYVASFNNGTLPAPFDDCFVARFTRALSLQYATYLNIGGGSALANPNGCGAIAGSGGLIGAGGDTFSATAFNLGAGGTSLANGFQPNFLGTQDTFLLVLDPSKSGTAQLVYGTYYGGGGATLPGYGALTISSSVVALVGNTTSGLATNPPDIPLVNAYQNANQAAGTSPKGTGFFAIVDTSKTGAASLLCSSYLGGTGGEDSVRSVAYDPVPGSATGYRIVLGGQTTSTNFPITGNALQSSLVGSPDAFLSVVNVPSTTAGPAASLFFSTYLGGGVNAGNGGEEIDGVATDAHHTIYARGRTPSDSFFEHTIPPTTVSGFQTTCSSCGPTHASPNDDVVVFVLATTPGATLESIAVTPVDSAIPLAQTQQFTATGTFSDGTIQDVTNEVTWSSSNAAAATISVAGLATAVGGGSTTIKAALGGVSGTSVLTVGAVSLVSIAVTPANPSAPAGGTLQFAATGTYSDASKQDLTNVVTWASSNQAVATINATGLATALTAGQSTSISATLGAISNSTNLTVTGAALASIIVTPVDDEVAIGSTVQFIATGLNSDGSTTDITSSVAWSSSNSGAATISAGGLATGVTAVQTVTITAGLGGATGSTSLLVVPAAQNQAANTILTVAGGGVNGSNPTAAYFPAPFAAVRDAKGNTYISVPQLQIVYKVDAQGHMAPFAGRGTATGQFDFIGDGLVATQASLDRPQGLALDGNGNLFIADSLANRVRRVDAVTHIITTVAGSGRPFFNTGYTGDGGPATKATMNGPSGVAVDGGGNVFIGDSFNNVVRRVDATTGVITTYAGNFAAGCSATLGDGGPATAASLCTPQSVSVDGPGNLFIADFSNSVVRKVDNTAQHIITSYIGNATTPCGPLGDGGPASAANVCSPTGVFVDSADNVFVADSGNDRVRRVDHTTLTISTVAGNGTPCTTAATNCGDGGAATSAQLNNPTSAFLDSTGNLVITDSGTQRVRVVSAGGAPTISNFAGGGNGGDNGPATSAVLGATSVVALDAAGNFYAVEGVRVRRIDAATQTITTYAGNGLQGVVGQPNGDGGPAASASFVSPVGIVIDAAGNIYIADNLARVVRKIDAATHNITTIAGTGAVCPNASFPGCGDGGPATAATFRRPNGLAIDSKGNLYISDPRSNRVRVVACGTGAAGCVPPAGETAGDIYAYAGTGTAGYTGDNGLATAAELNTPQGLGFDPQDSLYITDNQNNVIRKVDGTTHNITTYAFNGQPSFGGDGGAALAASMTFPQALGLDSKGNLFIGGGPDNVTQRVDAQSQTIVTLAGDVNNLDGGFTGDGGPATKALLENFGVEANASGIYNADLGNNRIRRVKASPAASVQGAFKPFAPNLVGDISTPQVVAVLNTGLDDLVVSGVGTTDASFPVANGCNLPVPPSGSCLLSVSLAPGPLATAGPINSALNFSTNDPNNPSFSLPLSGTVVANGTGVTLTVAFAGANGTGVVASVPPGINCVTPPAGCSASFPSGATVTLTAVPNLGSSFTGWTVAGAPAGTCPGTLPCTLTMNASQNVTATFDLPILTVAIIGNGSVASGAFNCTTATTPCSAKFAANTVLDLTPTATAPSVFVGWMGTACASVAGKPQDCNVTIGGPLAVLGVTQVTAVFSTPPKAFTQGDVFIGSSGGFIFEYSPAGNLVQALSLNGAGVFLGGGNIGAMTFDSQGNLYAPDFGLATGSVSTLAPNGTGPTLFRNGFAGSPNSVVVDTAGDVFVGLANTSRAVLEFGAGTNGAATATFFPSYEKGGANWITLLDDQRTMLYTSLGNDVKSFDVLVGSPYPDFAVNLPEPAFAVRELPDKTVLVAEGTNVLRLGPGGTVIQTYTPLPPAGLIESLYLDPDGSHFWAADGATGEVYEFNLLTGGVTRFFSTGLTINPLAGTGGIGGIAVFGSAVAGGADLAVSMSAANSIALGSSLTYTIQVTNNGPLNATGVTVTDNLPGGLTGANLSAGCTGTTMITCAIGNLASGVSTTVFVTVTPAAQGTLQNTATVAGAQADSDLSNNASTVTTTVGAPTLVSIAVTPANTSVAAGGGIQFTATGTFSDNTTQNLTNAVTWTSSDVTIATINAAGAATGVKAGGPVTIKAAQGAISGSTGLTVTAAPPTLVSIAVTPNPASVAVGLKIQFTATGTFSDGSMQNLTNTATWTSSDITIATVNAAGVATGVKAGGPVTIKAAQGAVSGQTNLTVTAATLVSIAVTPANPSIAAGAMQPFTATGTFSDGSMQNLTNTATWTSSDITIATINAAGVATGVKAGGPVTIKAAQGAVSGQTNLTVTAATLVSIAVTPANPSIAVGATQQFTATGTFSDGSMQNLTNTATWTSSDITIATVNAAGVATGVKAGGPVTIKAAQGAISGTANLTVTAATLVSIAVTPIRASVAVGATAQFTATGTFSDGSAQNLTTSVTWASSNAAVATISNASGSQGLATALKAGGTTITATQGSISASAILSTPFAGPFQAGEVLVSDGNGLVEVFTASGTSLGTLDTLQALTAGIAFDSTGNLYVTTFQTPTGVVKFDPTGKLLGPFGSGYTGNPESILFSQAGDAFVGAAQNPPMNPVPIFEFDTNGNPITTFQVAPDQRGTDWVELLQDQKTLLYTSEGKLVKSFNVSTNTQNPDFASGLPGTAAFALRQLPDGSVLVADTSVAVRLSGANGSVVQTYTPSPAPQALFALNLDPDGTSFWTADLATGVIYKFDIASGNQLASFTDSFAFASGVAIVGEKAPGTNNLTVTKAGTGTGIVTSNPAGIKCGAVCVAPFTDNTSVTLTATVDPGSTFGGFSANCTPPNPQTTPPTCAVAIATSDVTVTTTFSSVTLTSIAVTPANPSIAAGAMQQFTATGTFSDGSTQDITNTATWTSSNPAAATINFNGTPGLARAVGAGQSTITASQAGVSGSTVLTVAAATLVSIAVTPNPASVPAGNTLQFTATGTYSDNSTQNITGIVNWSSSDNAAATISNAAGSQGLATAGNTVGAATTITAASGGVTSPGVTLTVTASDVRAALAAYLDTGVAPVTITWNPPFADANYTAACTAETTPSDFLLPIITLRTPASMTVIPTSGGATGGILNCLAIPDSDTSDIRHGRVAFNNSPGTVVVSWNPVFPDANYTVACTLETQGNTAAGFTSSISALSAASVNVSAGGFAAGTMHCIAVPDSDAGTVRHGRVSFSSSPSTVTINWNNAFADANYAAACSDEEPDITSAAIAINAGSKLAGSMVTINELSSGTVHCLAAPAAKVLASIAVTPANPSIAAGATQQFTATGTFSDGSTQDLTSTATWTSSDITIATINAAGVATGVKAGGPVTIKAAQGAVSGQTNLTVTAATLVSIAVTPADPSIAAGAMQQFTATGTFSDGSMQNITNTATWTSSDITIATINAAGVATGVKAGGPVTIKAAQGAVSGQTNLTVTAATLVSIAVAPANAFVAAGKTQPFTATGTFSDGSMRNITNTATWTSSDVTIATINAAGVATGVKAGGPVTIKAAQGAISGTAQLTVTAAVLLSIAVTPANQSIAVGQTEQYQATGTFTDSSVKDITASVTWSSSMTNFATISAGGLATAIAAGQTTISATLNEVVGQTTLTVTTATFVFTPAAGNPASFNTTPGSTIDIGFTLTGQPGVKQTITLGCTTNAPQFLTCLVTPSSVTLTGNNSTEVAIVMSTFCKGSVPTFGPIPGGLGGGLAFLLAALALGGAAWTFRRRPRWALSFALLTLAALGGAGCNSGGSAGPSGRTPPGLYTVTISATANGQTQSIPIQVNVQP